MNALTRGTPGPLSKATILQILHDNWKTVQDGIKLIR